MMKTWAQVKLGKVLSLNNRAEKVAADRIYRLLGVRLAGQGPFLREEKSGGEIQASSLCRVEQGDFIYSRLFAWRGAFGVIPSEHEGAYVSNEFPTFTVVCDRLDPEYLRFYFARPSIWSEVEAFCTGTTKASRNRFKEQFFLNMTIPLPPLEEQCRIVARIEELSAKIEEARGLRYYTVQKSKALWNSALREAFQPLQIQHGVQTAKELLDKQATAHKGDDQKPYNGAHPWKPTILTEGPYALPKHWVWTDLGSVLVKLVDCINDTPDFSDSPTGLLGLKSTNVRPYKLDLSSKWYVTDEDFQWWNRREIPIFGDIVLTREAPMGNACIFPEEIRACLTQRLMLLRSDESFIRRRYILHYLNSSHFTEQVLDLCRGLTTPHIRVQDAPNIKVPLAPIIDQDRIVAYLDDLQEKVSSITRLQEETAEELNAFMPSILSRAFSGVL